MHAQSVHGCLCGRIQTHVEVCIYMCAFPCAQGKEGEGESELLPTGGQNMKQKQKQWIICCAFAFPASRGETLKGREMG